jgi:hypothetical protein
VLEPPSPFLGLKTKPDFTGSYADTAAFRYMLLVPLSFKQFFVALNLRTSHSQNAAKHAPLTTKPLEVRTLQGLEVSINWL